MQGVFLDWILDQKGKRDIVGTADEIWMGCGLDGDAVPMLASWSWKVMLESDLVFRKYTRVYSGVMGYHICSLLSNGSGKD